MTSEGIIQWFADHRDDMDFDGDIPEAFEDTLKNIQRSFGTRSRDRQVQGFIDSVITGNTGATQRFQTTLENWARPPLKEKIDSSKTRNDLNKVDRNLLSPQLRRDWDQQERFISRREFTEEFSGSDIKTTFGGDTIGTFARKTELSIDEAEDLLSRKGVEIVDGRVERFKFELGE